MAKCITKDKTYQINGEFLILIHEMALEEDPLKQLVYAGQIKEYLMTNVIDEII